MDDADPVQASWPELTCYGCGPANPDGLGIESYPDDGGLVATYTASADQNAGVADAAYGGLVASLVDCNSIWTAMVARNREEGRGPHERPAVPYVTGRLSVDYLAPTPLETPVTVRSRVAGPVGRTVRVVTDVGTEARPTARGVVVAVAAPDGPPARIPHGQGE